MWLWRVSYKRLASKKSLWVSATAYSLHYPMYFLFFSGGLLGVAFYWMGNQELLWSIYYAIPAIALIWLLANFARKGEEVILRKRRGQIDEINVHLAIRTLYITIILGGLLLLLPLLNISISGLLAFSGMGAIVAGIAAKDMLANLFGGFILVLDKPFRAGDWIVAPEKQLEGCVEHVGWRTTRLRTLEKEPISVPNSIFSTVVLQNRSDAFHRIIKTTLTLRISDHAHIKSIMQEIRSYLLENEMIDKDQSCLVYLDSPSLYGLPIKIRCYIHSDYTAEVSLIRGKVYLQIIDIFHKYGADLVACSLQSTP